jgi:hypothetical protein
VRQASNAYRKKVSVFVGAELAVIVAQIASLCAHFLLPKLIVLLITSAAVTIATLVLLRRAPR